MADSRATLKAFFETGDKPTEVQFASLIDSLLSLVDNSNLKDGLKIKSITNGKIEIEFNDNFLRFTTDGGGFAEAVFQMEPSSAVYGFAASFAQFTSTTALIKASALLTLEFGSAKFIGLPTFADNAAAITGGLLTDNVYKTATGELRIVV